MRRAENQVTKRMLSINEEGQRRDEMGCVKQDLGVKGVDCTLTADKNVWMR